MTAARSIRWTPASACSARRTRPRPAGARPAGGPPAPVPADRAEVHLAMLAYLGVPFTLCLLPLAIYLASLGEPPVRPGPRGRALSLSLTALLYTVAALIVGGVLALDSPRWPR